MNFQEKDPYILLNISPDAGPSEIKRAYRRLVRRFHPDVCGKSMANIKRFLAIKDAYSFLLKKHSPAPQSGDRSYEERARREKGQDGLFIFGKISLSQALHGTELTLRVTGQEDFCPHCKGLGNIPSPASRRDCPECSGRGVVSIPWAGEDLRIVCSRCSGTGSASLKACHICKGRGKIFTEQHITVSVPRGVRDGQVIKYPGLGPKDPKSGRPTCLFLTIEVEMPPGWKIKGKDIVSTIEVDCWSSLGGGKVHVQTLEGLRCIKLRAGSLQSDTIKVPGCGWIDEEGRRGDHIFSVKIKRPTGPCPPLARAYLHILKTLWPAKGFELRSLEGDRQRKK